MFLNNVFQVNVGCVPKKVHFSLFLLSQLAIEQSSTLHQCSTGRQILFTWLSSVQVMWNAAVHAEYLHDHSDYGFDVENVRFSWE